MVFCYGVVVQRFDAISYGSTSGNDGAHGGVVMIKVVPWCLSLQASLVFGGTIVVVVAVPWWFFHLIDCGGAHGSFWCGC